MPPKLTEPSSPNSPAVNTILPIIPYVNIQFTGRELGKGGFGTVREAKWQHTDVAVKQLNLGHLSDESLEEFTKEAECHARLRHPNVVTLFGVSLEPAKYCMVMELMVKGSLYGLLHNTQELPWTLRLSIAKDMVAGLSYLHEQNILHRDIKSLNVLLDDRGRAKLSDFGLSKVKLESASVSTAHHAVGTLPWMAPELFSRKAVFSQASDVYALGMVLWEIASRERPFKDSRAEAICSFVPQGEREDIPANTPPVIGRLITRCWSQKAEDRPHSKALADEIMAIQACDTPPPVAQTTSSVAQSVVAHPMNAAAVIQSGYQLFSGQPITPQPAATQKPPIQAFFQPQVAKQAILPLLLHVARGEQDEAKAILSAHPDYLLRSGVVTDYSNRKFFNITPFQYALWALDSHMWRMMLSTIPQNESGLEIIKALLTQYDALEAQGVAYEFKGQRRQDKHFDFTPLTTALKTYVDNYEPWTTEPCQNHWCKVVGGAQLEVPAHVAQEYCRPDRSFNPCPEFKEKTLPRGLMFKNWTTESDECWWGRDNKLGIDFGIYRREDPEAGGDYGGGWARALRGLDLVALTALCKVRTSEVAELKSQLLQATQYKSSAAMSY